MMSDGHGCWIDVVSVALLSFVKFCAISLLWYQDMKSEMILFIHALVHWLYARKQSREKTRATEEGPSFPNRERSRCTS